MGVVFDLIDKPVSKLVQSSTLYLSRSNSTTSSPFIAICWSKKLDRLRIEELYHSALKLEPHQRQVFLWEACTRAQTPTSGGSSHCSRISHKVKISSGSLPVRWRPRAWPRVKANRW